MFIKGIFVELTDFSAEHLEFFVSAVPVENIFLRAHRRLYGSWWNYCWATGTARIFRGCNSKQKKV